MANSTLQKKSKTAKTSKTETKTAKYAGIDYHLKFSMVTLGDEHGEQIDQEKLWHDDIPYIRKFFKQHKGIICAI
jgi:hypothetical protein